MWFPFKPAMWEFSPRLFLKSQWCCNCSDGSHFKSPPCSLCISELFGSCSCFQLPRRCTSAQDVLLANVQKYKLLSDWERKKLMILTVLPSSQMNELHIETQVLLDLTDFTHFKWIKMRNSACFIQRGKHILHSFYIWGFLLSYICDAMPNSVVEACSGHT